MTDFKCTLEVLISGEKVLKILQTTRKFCNPQAEKTKIKTNGCSVLNEIHHSIYSQGKQDLKAFGSINVQTEPTIGNSK